MSKWNARPTRYKGLGYIQVDATTWQFVDTLEPGHDAQIGAHYRSKAELLADVERFAQERGFEVKS